MLPQESRRSLYFLSDGYDAFFDPSWAHSLQIKQASVRTYTDFVRYLSLLFQYHKDRSASTIARGFKQVMEKYYERFIYAMVNDTEDSLFGRITDIFPNKNYPELNQKLQQAISVLEIPSEYPSIIDMDVYLFGLIYVILFEKKDVDDSKKDELKADLVRLVEGYKIDSGHTKAPAALKYLRARITASITTYKKYY